VAAGSSNPRFQNNASTEGQVSARGGRPALRFARSGVQTRRLERMRDCRFHELRAIWPGHFSPVAASALGLPPAEAAAVAGFPGGAKPAVRASRTWRLRLDQLTSLPAATPASGFQSELRSRSARTRVLFVSSVTRQAFLGSRRVPRRALQQRQTLARPSARVHEAGVSGAPSLVGRHLRCFRGYVSVWRLSVRQ
jgi:hypothetical protein